MASGHELRFLIDIYTPETLPMARLAEYMADLARLYGEQPNVHFVKLEAGSTVIVNAVDDEAMPKVLTRTKQVRDGNAPEGAMKAFQSLNRLLKEDNGVGALSGPDGAEIIRFPGREEAAPVTFGAFNQEGTLDGKIIRIGGTGDPVPVVLESDERPLFGAYASRALARTLGQHLFGPELRFHGMGRWHRDDTGNWILDRFTINWFEVLNQQALGDLVAHLRDVPGNAWRDIEDPWDELDRIRGADDEVN